MIAYIPLDSSEVAFQCPDNIKFKTCNSHNIREETLRRYFKEQLTKLHCELISNQNRIYEKLGVLELSNMKSKLDSCIKRINELDVFIKALFEAKFNREISDNDFKMMNSRYLSERKELQNIINELSEKISTNKKIQTFQLKNFHILKLYQKMT